MKHQILPRLASAAFFMTIFSVVPWLINVTQKSAVDRQVSEEIAHWSTVDLIEEFQLSLSTEFLNDKEFQVTFRRDTEGYFDIPGKQTQQVSSFCDGQPKQMRIRNPIIISMDEGRRDIGLTYPLEEWGYDKVKDWLSGDCDLNVTRTYELTLIHNIKRTVELKSSIRWPDSLVLSK